MSFAMKPSKRSTALTTVATAMLLGSCAPVSLPPEPAPKPQKQFLNLNPEQRPNGYTHGVTSPPGKMVFVSGQGGAGEDGVMPADFETQAENTFKNIAKCLELGGATFADVVKINYYLKDMNDLTALRGVRAKYLNMEAPPAATAVQTGLSGTMLLEVEVVAVVAE
jgi:enamine deaminase RidA (YjgF/YER057c/UK114 family)